MRTEMRQSLADTLPEVRYWSEVLLCTITTRISDLQGHRLWNFKLKFFFYFAVMKKSRKKLRQIVGRTLVSLVILICGSWSEGQHDPYFMVQWFCLLKTIWCISIILWDYESVWLNVWPQNKCRSLWPIFHGPVILPCILKTVWCMNIVHVLCDYESVWHVIWPQNKCRSLWPIFHVPVILPNILNSIWWMNVILLETESV